MRPKCEPCAGGIVLDGAGRLLVIRRGTPPGLGRWSIPGGRCQPGESAREACVREIAEETGLQVRIERHAGQVLRPGTEGVVYQIDDYVCSLVGGTLQAGDDAAQARWVTRADLVGLDLVPGLLEALTEWDALPQ